MTLTVKTLALGIVALAVGASLACSPEKPATPTYAKDVGPIFAAHCNRCHSGKGPGGAFLGEPDASTPLPLPQSCHLDFYEGDPTICAAADGGSPPASCMGAHTCAGLISAYIQNDGPLRMPPAPATKLDDWEIDVVVRWAKQPLP